MAWRTERTDIGVDIVIDGFGKGIAPTPFDGIADMRNVNLISQPGVAAVNSTTTKTTPTTFSAKAFTFTAATNLFAFTGTNQDLSNGQALTFASITGCSGLSAGTVYWVGGYNSVAQTFQVYSTVGATTGSPTTLVVPTTDGSGTFTTVNIGLINQYSQATPGGTTYCIDANGRAWILNSSYMPVFLGNTTLTNASGGGIAIWHGYIFVFRNTKIDYCAASGTVSWQYGWQPDGANDMNTSSSFTGSHRTLVGQDDELYYCDGHFIGSLQYVNVNTAFDPVTSSTYTWARQALILPALDTMNCLAYLGDNLLIGGSQNFIYSWDRVLTNQYTLIVISENNVHQMVTANTNVFIFAGSRGRIYITNGSQADLYMKIPDHLSGTIEPNLQWGGAMFNRNQLYFGLTAYNPQDGTTAINQYGGVWAIDVSSGYGGSWLSVQNSNVMRHTNILSYGTYAGYMSAIVPLLISKSVTGGSYDVWAFHCGWFDGTATYGTDASFSPTGNTNPYSNYETYIISDAIPFGTILNKKTPRQIEFKLSVPLASSSEAVRLSYRLDKTMGDSSTFTTICTTDGTNSGTISDAQNPNFQKAQWLQIRAELKSTSSSPSYVPLKEIRIHL